MKLTIKNEDAQRTAVVTVEEFEMGKTEPATVSAGPVGPGESREVWIHASRRVVVIEDALASIPKP